MDISNLRKEFPILNQDLIYFDNSATTQKPAAVIDSIVDFYSNYNSNVHRGLYPIAAKATEAYEKARATVARFINASPEEIIFTSGTTESINFIASSLAKSGLIQDKPKILLTELEHHSNVVPWQELEDSRIDYLKLGDDYNLVSGDEANLLHKRTRFDSSENVNLDKSVSVVIGSPQIYDIFSFSLVSNVTGSIFDVSKLNEIHKKTEFIVCDAAQAASHMKIDVKELDIDFLAFSGHKIFGPMGIGVLYAKEEILSQLEPVKTGGGMIRNVERQKSEWAENVTKFEAGTPNVEGVIGLAKAIKFIKQVGFDDIKNYENELREYMLQKLLVLPEIRLFHPPLSQNAAPIFSFEVKNVHAHDIAEFLGQKGICVRAGHHCTQILHREVLDVNSTVRASLAFYNTREEIDKFIEVLKEAKKLFNK